MNINEYLNGFYKGTKEPSLDAMRYFMKELSHPEKKLKIIHVAGTNGKGSIVEMLSNVLEKAGYKTGKFISPHIISHNERISINHKWITDEEMKELIDMLHPIIEKYNQTHEVKVTFFELETTMALLYFAKHECDIVVLETGLGGLYDCTNIVHPLISAISIIGYDHMDILGSTLEEIAIQKAGIIKENSETVFIKQESQVTKIMEDTCKAKNNTLHLIEKQDIRNVSYNELYQKFDYKEDKQIEINIKGKRQFENASIVLECVKILRKYGYKIEDQKLRSGLKTVVHKGRFETICDKPLIIFDGGHNETAIQNLKESIKRYYNKEERVYIISILKTKDYKTILKELLEDKDAMFIFTDGLDQTEDENKRYVEKEVLYEESKKYKIENIKTDSLKNAIKTCKKQEGDKAIFVIGSFYVYQEVIETVKEEKYD